MNIVLRLREKKDIEINEKKNEELKKQNTSSVQFLELEAATFEEFGRWCCRPNDSNWPLYKRCTPLQEII